jgi:hypothetical protein
LAEKNLKAPWRAPVIPAYAPPNPPGDPAPPRPGAPLPRSCVPALLRPRAPASPRSRVPALPRPSAEVQPPKCTFGGSLLHPKALSGAKRPRSEPGHDGSIGMNPTFPDATVRANGTFGALGPQSARFVRVPGSVKRNKWVGARDTVGCRGKRPRLGALGTRWRTCPSTEGCRPADSPRREPPPQSPKYAFECALMPPKSAFGCLSSAGPRRPGHLAGQASQLWDGVPKDSQCAMAARRESTPSLE